ncbi:hypothetical protein KW414_21455, partial [Vibrio fluvialis]|nr:hypothetical protein [Vibrio fluvialis]
ISLLSPNHSETPHQGVTTFGPDTHTLFRKPSRQGSVVHQSEANLSNAKQEKPGLSLQTEAR